MESVYHDCKKFTTRGVPNPLLTQGSHFSAFFDKSRNLTSSLLFRTVFQQVRIQVIIVTFYV